MHIDQARADDHARGVDNSRRLESWLLANANDVLAANPKVGNQIQVLRRIDDAAIGDAEDVHALSFVRSWELGPT